MMKKTIFVFLAVLLSATIHAADITNGRRLVETNNCISCHGADLKTPISAEYPKIAGQHKDYLLHAMLAYQANTNNQWVGRSNPIMVGQMAKFSRQELEDIAAYIASLAGDLGIKR